MPTRVETVHAPRATAARRQAYVFEVSSALMLGSLLLAGCGGGDSDSVTLAPSSSLSAQLDADTLPSIDMAAQQAADARGAPGEAEAVVYMVSARRPEDAVRMAAALEARGFAPVRVVERSASELAR